MRQFRTFLSPPWILAALLAAGAASALAGPLATNAPPDTGYEKPLGEAYQAGLAALVAGDLDQAQKAFEAAAKAEPRSAAPLLGQAEVAFRRKKPYDALARIKEALETSPNDSAAHASMGRYLLVTGKPKEAEQSLQKAIQLDSRAVRPRIDLADLYAGLRQWKAAVPLYEAALALQPQHAGAHYALGLAYGQHGQADKSKASLDKAWTMDPNNPLPGIALARWHASRKELPQAQAALDEALKRDPKNLDALLFRGDLMDAAKDVNGALGAYDQAAKVHPQSPAPLLRQAMLLHRTGQEAKALPVYIKAADLDPKNPLVLNNIADIYSQRKDGLADAERWANKALAVAPKSAEVHDTLGWIQRAKGNLPAARASLERANQLDPTNGETLYRLAQVQADLGDKAKARQALQAALKAKSPIGSAEAARKLQTELGG